MKKDLPSPQLLRKLLQYDKATGKLFWRERTPDMFPSASSCKSWNTRYSGREALCYVDRNGYKYGTIRGKRVSAHRAIWALINGDYPSGDVDHINGVPDDNMIENLRDVSRSTNLKNCCIRSNNKSGFVGVSFHSRSGLWRAEVQSNGIRTHIGYYSKPLEAAEARRAAQDGMGFTKRHGSHAIHVRKVMGDEQ